MITAASARPARRRPLRRPIPWLIALTLALALAAVWADRASAAELCDGYTSCSTNGYTTHGYQNVAATSFWRMYAGDDCTNYVAYVESSAYGAPTPEYLLGNAGEWAVTASAHGVEVNQTPTVGAVAEWNGGDTGMGADGHVAVVEAVGPNDSYIVISQQDIGSDTNGYDWQEIEAGSSTAQWEPWPDNFIHLAGSSAAAGTNVGAAAAPPGGTSPEAGTPAEGSFVSSDGLVYRIAGGAPIYVSSWDVFGGSQPVSELSDAQFAALPDYPREGTVLDGSDGGVYIVAGGAPLFVNEWMALGGPRPGVEVDEAAVQNAGGGGQWNHLRMYPANGTFVETPAGAVYRIAGGAPFAVAAWSVFGGVQSYVTVNQWDLENRSNPLAHLRATPANGTLVEGLPSRSYWSFSAGKRRPAQAGSGATALEDVSLDSYMQGKASLAEEITAAKGKLNRALAACHALAGGKRGGCEAQAEQSYSRTVAPLQAQERTQALAACHKTQAKGARTACEAKVARAYSKSR